MIRQSVAELRHTRQRDVVYLSIGFRYLQRTYYIINNLCSYIIRINYCYKNIIFITIHTNRLLVRCYESKPTETNARSVSYFRVCGVMGTWEGGYFTMWVHTLQRKRDVSHEHFILKITFILSNKLSFPRKYIRLSPSVKMQTVYTVLYWIV